MSEHLPPHSILEALQPDPGWRTDAAILSTYSLDLYTAVAVLLALGGVVDDAGSAAAHELAATLESLSGRIRILAQRGRITAPGNFPRGLGILDRFVEERAFDESENSWHAKIVIARYVNEEIGGTRWRCWIGSRNLTKASNWDLGLLLVGSPDDGFDGAPVRGISGAWSALTKGLEPRVRDAGSLTRELDRVRWSLSEGTDRITAASFHLLLPGDSDRGYPQEFKEDFDQIWIVSPFLGVSAVRVATNWGGPACSRILVSSANDLRKIAATASGALERLGEIRMTDGSSDGQASGEEGEQSEEAPDNEDALEELAGLHAKFIVAQRGDRAVVWMGSPNLTHRAWHSNAEAIVRLKIGDDVLEGLRTFVDASRPVTESVLRESPPEEESNLDHARRLLSAITDVRQERREAGFIVHSTGLGRLTTPELAVSLGRVTASVLKAWPVGGQELFIPSGDTAAVETELLRVRLDSGSDSAECVIFAPLHPPPGDERDRAAIASLLRPSGLLSWLAGILEPGGQLTLEGEHWERQLRTGGDGRSGIRSSLEDLSLESILRAWIRDPDKIEVAKRKAERYLAAVLEAAEDESEEHVEALRMFEKTWRVVTSTLADRHV